MPINDLQLLKETSLFTRLKDVSTMLSPPSIYTNRLKHIEQVCETAKVMESSFPFNLPDLLYECCLFHDLGHCCFAHEGEDAFSDFISKHLFIDKEKAGFSHAINGVLMLIKALKAKDNRKLKSLLYTDSEKLRIIFDSIAKHSINDNVVNGVYFSFVNNLLRRESGDVLSIVPSVEPQYDVGNYVRVADDISTKDSDVIDLFHHYYKEEYNKLLESDYDIGNRFFIRDLYIKKLSSIAKCYYDSKKLSLFNVDREMKKLSSYQSEKELLKISYGFSYKKHITHLSQLLISELLDLISNDVYLLENTSYKKLLNFIVSETKKSALVNIKQKGFLPKTFNIEFLYKNINTIGKLNYRQVLSDFLCSIVYEFSSLTDTDLLLLA